MVVGGWCSQQLLSLNQTSVLVVLLLGLCLLLGCDNNPTTVSFVLLLGLFFLLGCENCFLNQHKLKNYTYKVSLAEIF